MPTRSVIQRGLLARVRGLSGAWIEDGPTPIVYLIPRHEGANAQLVADAQVALEDLVAFPTRPEVRVAHGGAVSTEGTGLVGIHRFAALSSEPTEDGLRRGLVKLVPDIERLVLEPGLGWVRFHVADADNACPPEFLGRVRAALRALSPIGAEYEAVPLAPDDERNDLRDPGFFIPARDRKLAQLREEDEARFAQRLIALAESDEVEEVPLVDQLDGVKIFSTIGVCQAPLGAFLPMYDHIYLMMSPGKDTDAADYYKGNYGLTESDLLAYVRRKKIIPVFKFELGVYPEPVWRRFSEDLSLPYLSARDVDYACARHAWSSAEWVRILRSDRSVSQELFAQLRSLTGHSTDERTAAAILRNLLNLAERFEGEFWRRGHLAAGNYSPAMPLAEYIHHSTPFSSQSMAPIEVEGAAMHLSMALALGSATYEGLVQNESLLHIVAQRFGNDAAPTERTKGEHLQQILDALELSYSPDIPPDEYMNIVDESNARRIRELVSELIDGQNKPETDLDLRERIQRYNDGVSKIERAALSTAEISLFTGLGARAFGVDWLKAILGGLSSAATGRVAQSVDSTLLGDGLDWLRGKLNRVPAQSIRLYRIRSHLDQARRKASDPSKR